MTNQNPQMEIAKFDVKLFDQAIKYINRAKIELEGAEITAVYQLMDWLNRFRGRMDSAILAHEVEQKQAKGEFVNNGIPVIPVVEPPKRRTRRPKIVPSPETSGESNADK